MILTKYAYFPRHLINVLFESRPPSGYVPLPEAQRIFASEHDPSIREIVTRLGPMLKGATMLDRHRIGACYNFVRDHRLHLPETPRAADYFQRHFGLSPGTRSGVFLAADMAAGLERSWIEGAVAAPSLETAAEICRGDPMLASWIRRLLYEQAPDLGWLRPHRAMLQVVSVLHDHLRRWPEGARVPSEDDVLGWLDLIRRGRPLPEIARPPWETTGAPSQV